MWHRRNMPSGAADILGDLRVCCVSVCVCVSSAQESNILTDMLAATAHHLALASESHVRSSVQCAAHVLDFS